MRKTLFAVLFLFAALCSHAEAVRLNTGVILSGSITEQAESYLILLTPYGYVTVPTRDIVSISPDKHRVFLKGGGEFVGEVMDLDQFNLRLKTDDGIVNIDVPKIASFEVYDYNQAEKQKAFAQAQQKTEEQKEETKEAGGLVIDSDLDRVFGGTSSAFAAPAPIPVRTTAPVSAVSAPAASAPALKAAPSPASAPASATTVTDPLTKQKIYMDPLPENSDFRNEERSKVKDSTTNIPLDERQAYRYFSVEAGVHVLDLKYLDEDVGGTGGRGELKYMWRLGKSNFWLGGILGLGVIPKTNFDNAGDRMKTNGNIINLGLASNYYLTPNSKFRTYLIGAGGYSNTTLDVTRTTPSLIPGQDDIVVTSKVKSNGFFGGAGIGVERRVADITLGAEFRVNYSPRSGDLSESSDMFYTASIKASWKI